MLLIRNPYCIERFIAPSVRQPGADGWSAGIFRLQFFVLTELLFKEKSEHI